MQVIEHKIPNITTPQKFFVEKGVELLYRGSIDSYRVRVKSPKSILEELRTCLTEFEIGKIKHFQTIAGHKDVPSLKEEAIALVNKEKNYLKFNSFSKDYFIDQLRGLSETGYKQVRNCISFVLRENENYLNELIAILKEVLLKELEPQERLDARLTEIDKITNILFTELIDKGYSKNFLYRFFTAVFVNNPKPTFAECMVEIEEISKCIKRDYEICFRLQSSDKVKEALKFFGDNIRLINDLKEIITIESKEFARFSKQADNVTFIIISIKALDHFSALRKAKITISENMDLLHLGFADQYLNLNNRALVIDKDNPEGANFQIIENFLDGMYKAAKEHYQSLIDKVPTIFQDNKIKSETREKIKAAIRYLRLGNEAFEVEHKFINYWIGIEYLFSNYDSQSTINRVKEFLVKSHAVIYIKRNLTDFYKDVKKTGKQGELEKFTVNDQSCLLNREFYKEVGAKFTDSFPLIAYRARKFEKLLFEKSTLKDYIEYHQLNLTIHLTRIYRIRNEIIHDAATDSSNENITANLRYYLTFMLNAVIDYFSKTADTNVGIEDFFILQEIRLGNIIRNGYVLSDFMVVESSIDFIN